MRQVVQAHVQPRGHRTVAAEGRSLDRLARELRREQLWRLAAPHLIWRSLVASHPLRGASCSVWPALLCAGLPAAFAILDAVPIFFCIDQHAGRAPTASSRGKRVRAPRNVSLFHQIYYTLVNLWLLLKFISHRYASVWGTYERPRTPT
jgi:hypothetical protein